MIEPIQYKGMDLEDYCKLNEINFSSILSRIESLKTREECKGFTLEQLADKAINNYWRNYKYSYKGYSLNKYCELNGINIGKVYSRIKSLKLKEEYKNLNDEDIIEIAIYKEGRLDSKYFYKGVVLSKYCEENNLSLYTIYTRIRDLKKRKENKALSDDEIVEIAINYTSKEARYWYKGMMLKQYCLQENIDFKSVAAQIKLLEKNEKYKTLSDEELIEVAIYKVNKNYENNFIRRFCKERNLNPQLVKSKINNLRKKEENSKLTLEQLVNKVMNGLTVKIKHVYEGVPLIQYCEDLGLNYNYVMGAVYNEMGKTNCSIEAAIKVVIDKCEKSLKEKEMFSLLEKASLSNGEVEDVCLNLDVDYNGAKELIGKVGVQKAIKIIWYFGIRDSKTNKRYISNDALETLKMLSQRIKTESKEEASKESLYVLQALYKCKLVDTREAILIKTCNSFARGVSKFSEEEIKKVYLDLLDSIVFNKESIFNAAYYKRLQKIIGQNQKRR